MPFTEIYAAFRWWVILVLLGTAVTPLAFHLFKKLPDRGYSFTKMLGLLLVSYLFWLGNSLGLLMNEFGSIIVALILVVVFSIWAYRQEKDSLRTWLAENWRTVLLTELIFLFIYVFWVWVRSQNPTIAATEKPMDFAFLNAIGRSPTFPPLDPWLSGFAISYYYFGYLMTSVLARLTAVAEPIAFNLALAWLVAGTAVGAFGLVYNLIATYGQKAKRAAIALAIVAAIAIPIGGNLEIILEVLHGNDIGPANLWTWLDVRDLNSAPSTDLPPRYENSFWWWWRASRPINEYSLAGESIEGLEPITEFPSFSFVLGDLHPHVMALPFAFLSLALALAWWLRTDGDNHRSLFAPRLWDETAFLSKCGLIVREVGLPLWFVTAVVLGGLSFLNTWDVLIHLFIVSGAFFLAQWRTYGWSNQIITKTIFVVLLLAIPAVILYLPFYIGFRSQAGPPFLLPMLNRPTRLSHFLIIFGLPLGVITVLMLVLVIKQRLRHWWAGLLTAVSLVIGLLLLAMFLGWVVAASEEGWRVANVASELGISLPARPDGPIAPFWAAQAVLAIIPAYLGDRISFPGVTILLAAIIGMAVMLLLEWLSVNEQAQNQTALDDVEPTPALSTPPAWPFVLLLILTGALLTLGPEFVYLKDNFGVRLNTVFKFYYQAWVLFGTTAVFGIYYLWRSLASRSQKVVPALVTAGYALIFLLSLLFPYYAIQSRAVEFRGQADAVNRLSPTINGLAHIQVFNPDEYAAIMWLRENIDGTPVIVESVGGQYSGFGRISSTTGLPTLVGWAGHEYQWRGDSTREPDVRDPAVRDIYTSPAWEGTNAELLLDQYGVELIYVGGLEVSTYAAGGDTNGLDKFRDRLEVAYQNPSVTIYRWQPQGSFE